MEGFSHHLPPKYLQKHLWESSRGTREDTEDTTQPSSPSMPFSAPHHHLPASLQCCPAWTLVPGENSPKAKKKNIEVFKRHQQSSPRSNTGGTRRSQQVPRLLTLFFFLPQLPVRSIS